MEMRTKDSIRFNAKIWLDYENQTNVNKTKRNENTTATTYSQDLQARRKNMKAIGHVKTKTPKLEL